MARRDVQFERAAGWLERSIVTTERMEGGEPRVRVQVVFLRLGVEREVL